MNIKAIIGSLVLGSSSLAMAAPSVTFTAHGDYTAPVIRSDARVTVTAPVWEPRYRPTTEPMYRPTYRPIARPVAPIDRGTWSGDSWKYRWNHPVAQPVYAQAPVTLASDMSFSNEGRRFITVGGEVGQFGKLEIRGDGAGTFIKQVYVQFDDGQEQVLHNLDRTLTNQQCLTVDLDGYRRGIRRIVVYGSDLDTGWQRSGGGFTVTAV